MLEIDPFAGEAFRHADTGYGLVEIAVDQRQALAGGAIGKAHPVTPIVGEDEHQRHDSKGDQGQLPVQDQHRDDNPGEDKDGAKQADNRPGEKVLQHTDITNETAH